MERIFTAASPEAILSMYVYLRVYVEFMSFSGYRDMCYIRCVAICQVVQFEILLSGKHYPQLHKMLQNSCNCPEVTLVTLANK